MICSRRGFGGELEDKHQQHGLGKNCSRVGLGEQRGEELGEDQHRKNLGEERW